MDGSGFGNISTQPKAPASKQGGGNRQVIQIIKLPQGLENSAKALRIEGQLSDVKPNGDARLSTPQGDIEIKIKGRPLPQTGQRAEIEIPAARTRPDTGSTTPDKTRPIQGNIRAVPNTAPTATTPNTPQAPVSTQTPPPAAPTTTPVNTSANKAPSRPIPEPVVPTTQDTRPPQQTAKTPENVLETLRNQAIKPQNIEKTLETGTLVRAIQTTAGKAQLITLQSQQTLSNIVQTIKQGNITNALPPVIKGINTGTINIAKTSITTSTITPQPPSATLLTLPPSNNILQTNEVLRPSITIPPQGNPNITQGQITQVSRSGDLLFALSQITTGNTAIQTAGSKNAPTASPITPAVTTAPTSTPLSENPAQILTRPALTFTPAGNILSTSHTPSAHSAPHNNHTIPSNNTTPVQKFDFFLVQISNTPKVHITTPLHAGGISGISTGNQNQFLQNTAPPTATILNNTTATNIPAHISAITPNGLPLVTTQWPNDKFPSHFVLQFRANNLPVGTQLTLSPVFSSTQTQTTNQTGALDNASLLSRIQNLNLSFFNASGWPAIEELYNSLLQTSPQLALSTLNSLPTAANANALGPAAMVFIAAVKSGDFNGWLGDKKIDALQKTGKENLLRRLSSDALRSGQGTTSAPETTTSSEWRPVSIPLFWEGEIQKIMLYTRQENQQKEENDDKKSGQTRFIFDLNLSRMGAIQIDGLLKQQRLDLIIRTDHQFSDPMQKTMQNAYNKALTHTELDGDLSFQGQSQGWVHVLKEQKNLGVEA